MSNRAEEVEINIDADQVTVALSKWIRSLLLSKNILIKEANSFWDVIEQLDQASFNALKTNVYFADVLRSIYFTQKASQDKSFNALEASDLQPENETIVLDTTQSPPPKSPVRNDIQECTFPTPPLNTNLDSLELPGKFMKLIKRLRNVSDSPAPFTLGEKLYDLITLPVYAIENLPNVGAWYVHTFKELKIFMNQPDDNSIQPNDELDFSAIDTSDFRISLVGVDESLIKPLEKYARFHKFDDFTFHIDDFLSLKRDELLSKDGFGQAAVSALMEFKRQIEHEIKAIISGKINYLNFESRLIVPKNINGLPLQQIEQLLLDDIDLFLDRLSDEDVDIVQRRWGYVEQKETLEDIGVSYNVSRERIRQKEAINNKIFLKCLRLHPNIIWELIESELDRSFPEKWPDIYSCFSSEKAFYEFLDLICQKNNLFNFVYPEIDKSLLNSYFAENGAPSVIEDIAEYLAALELPTIRNISNAIHHLVAQDVLSLEGEFVWPKLLGKSEASACVLVNYPKGLPWLDIAKLVNANKLSRSKIYEDRLDHQAFKNRDYLYLAGKGVYKHTNFMSSEVIKLDEIFLQLTKFVESSGRDIFHLNECYSASDELKRVDYYEIRHFVKHFGEDYGFYFDGRSQADSVGLKKGFKKITQKEVIIEAMNNREKPYTKPEIANLLKSKSLGHAAFYLDQLIEDGRVVQFDRMLYTTPDQAYRNIDVNAYLDALQNVLISYGKPVEPSIFKEELNQRFSKSYSKYFYASIARLYSNSKGWQRMHSLYSLKQIPYRNLKDVIQNVCSLNFSTNENIDAIQKHIAITKHTAFVAITNWRNQPDIEIH
ncbi:sigma factor-like helix-turn-helix DNA-binding protein [Neptunicella sp. SCSIO 80796]|uniref:sigma factor-like helix-turn-helix DNA-binding protein n=1 Tax=Neptunicella plasticusilytica TaxID=3117012 RepID=UPI003A4E07BB